MGITPLDAAILTSLNWPLNLSALRGLEVLLIAIYV